MADLEAQVRESREQVEAAQSRIMEVTARIDPTNRPQPEESVSFAFDEAALYLFDPETGASLKTKRDGAVPTTPDSIPNREGVESTTGASPGAGSNDEQLEETIE